MNSLVFAFFLAFLSGLLVLLVCASYDRVHSPHTSSEQPRSYFDAWFVIDFVSLKNKLRSFLHHHVRTIGTSVLRRLISFITSSARFMLKKLAKILKNLDNTKAAD